MEENRELLREELEAELPEIPAVEEGEVQLPVHRILYVMAIVAVLCGGNGAGIVAAGLYWKAAHHVAGAIAIAAGATAAALLIVVLIVVLHKRNVKKKLEQGDAE